MKKVKTSFSIDPGLLAELTKEAKDVGMSRSQYVSKVIKSRHYLNLLDDVERNAKFVRKKTEEFSVCVEGKREDGSIIWNLVQRK